VHLVGFIIRIYHDARSPERQKRTNSIANLSTFNNDNPQCTMLKLLIFKQYLSQLSV